MDIAGRTLSHYRVIEKLGQGASGLVYLAEDLVLGRPVVLKRLPPDAGEHERQRALVEARTIAALNHPNICTLYEYAEAEDEQFLVLEVLEGQTLEALVAQGPLPLAQVLDLGVQLADALDAAHTHGIVHRDIKPPNVFVTFRGQAKILDFGIATLSSPGGASRYTAGATSAGTRSLYGTLHYMAPEQIRGEVADARSDLFSLGAVLYEMTTGRRAFDGTDPADVAAALLGGTPRALRTVQPDAPVELERIIGRALEKQPDLRCQSAADLRADLQRLKRQMEAGAMSPPAHPAGVAAAAATPLAAVPPPDGTTVAGPATAVAPVPVRPRAVRRTRSRRPTRYVTTVTVAAAIVIAAAIGIPIWLLRGAGSPASTPIADATMLAPSEVPPLPTLTPGPPAPATVWLDLPSDSVADPATVATAGVGGHTGAGRRRSPSAATVPPAGTDAAAAAPTVPPPPTYERELQEGRTALDARQFEQAATVLREVAAKAGDTGPGIDAQILLAHVQARQRQVDEAVAAYAAVVARYPDHPKAAEAMYYQAQALLGTKRADRDSEARKLLTEIADRFPGHPFVARALLSRGEIESRRQTYQHDPVLGKAVPAALVTYRTLVELGGTGREREHGLWRLAQAYERIERFDLAAQTYRDLGEAYADTRYDAWASAGRIYDRRLNDPVLARAAYQRVPSTSPAFKDAQKYVSRSAS